MRRQSPRRAATAGRPQRHDRLAARNRQCGDALMHSVQCDKAQTRVLEERPARPGSRHQVHQVRATRAREPPAEFVQRVHLQAMRRGQGSRAVLASRPPQPTPWLKLQSMPADPPRRAPSRETSRLGELWPRCLRRHVLRGVTESRSGKIAVDVAGRRRPAARTAPQPQVQPVPAPRNQSPAAARRRRARWPLAVPRAGRCRRAGMTAPQAVMAVRAGRQTRAAAMTWLSP